MGRKRRKGEEKKEGAAEIHVKAVAKVAVQREV